MKSIESIDKTAKSIGAFDSINYGSNTNTRAKYLVKDHRTEIVVESTSEKKDLSVWIDDKLKFTSHVGQ